MMRKQRCSIVAALAFMAAFQVPVTGRAQPERVQVVNQLDRDVLVWVNGDPRVFVGPNATGSTTDVPEGPVLLQATCPKTGELLATERTSMAPGETFTWTLYPVGVVGEEQGTGVVVVENGLDRSVEVRLGGNLYGWIAPGAVRVEPRIVAGTVTATATDDAGTVLAERTLTVAPGEIVRWRIGTGG